MTKRKVWTNSEYETLRALYADTPTKDIATQLGRSLTTIYQTAYRLGLEKSAEYLASPDACRLRRGDQVGKANRFKPGQKAHNKGLRRPGWSEGRGRMQETQFKKGSRTGIADTTGIRLERFWPTPKATSESSYANPYMAQRRRVSATRKSGRYSIGMCGNNTKVQYPRDTQSSSKMASEATATSTTSNASHAGI